jgi:hypothetical protein
MNTQRLAVRVLAAKLFLPAQQFYLAPDTHQALL